MPASVAKYIYAHDTLWQYQRARLSELIEQTNVAERRHCASASSTADGALGARRRAAALAGLLLVRSSPIVVAGARRSDASRSRQACKDLLRETALLAILSWLFGFGVFLAVRTLPLKVLDQTLGALANTNSQFDAAINNMSQGLLLFDADQRVVVVNRKYIEMYGLSPGGGEAGLPL